MLGNTTWSVSSSYAGTTQGESKSSSAASTSSSSKTTQQPDEYISNTGTVATRESLNLESSEEVSSAQAANGSASEANADGGRAGGAPPANASAEEETASSSETVGKPAWISDADWAAILENPNQKPSGMSDDDWTAYLQWAGKSSGSSVSSSTQQVETTEKIVAEDRATSTSKETALRSSSENANRYIQNSDKTNTEIGTRIDVSA